MDPAGGTPRPILEYPDPRLSRIARQVTRFDADLALLAEDLLASMYKAKGRGLAAPQIGVMSRVFVMDVAWKTDTPAPRVVANPVVMWQSQETTVRLETCLSIPGQPRRISRPSEVQLSFQDETGALHMEMFEGFSAACALHEIDHLEGRLILDHLEAE